MYTKKVKIRLCRVHYEYIFFILIYLVFFSIEVFLSYIVTFMKVLCGLWVVSYLNQLPSTQSYKKFTHIFLSPFIVSSF